MFRLAKLLCLQGVLLLFRPSPLVKHSKNQWGPITEKSKKESAPKQHTTKEFTDSKCGWRTITNESKKNLHQKNVLQKKS